MLDRGKMTEVEVAITVAGIVVCSPVERRIIDTLT